MCNVRVIEFVVCCNSCSFILRVFNFNQTYVVDTLEHFGVTQFSELEIQTICGIFDSNAFESTSSRRVACRGLYLMSSLINSSCLPNTRHFFKVATKNRSYHFNRDT